MLNQRVYTARWLRQARQFVTFADRDRYLKPRIPVDRPQHIAVTIPYHPQVKIVWRLAHEHYPLTKLWDMTKDAESYQGGPFSQAGWPHTDNNVRIVTPQTCPNHTNPPTATTYIPHAILTLPLLAICLLHLPLTLYVAI
jgi:hypothetical protein